MRPLMPWQRLLPIRASRWRSTTRFLKWRRTIPTFAKKFASASVLRPNSRSSSPTEVDVADIDDEICSHALVDRSNGSRVRVISASAQWPAAAVRRCLRHG